MKQMVAEIDALPEGLEGYFSDSFADSISKLRQAIEQAEKQEPVAGDVIYAAWHGAGVDIAGGNWTRFVSMLPPLYTTPQPQREWVGLTDEDVDYIADEYATLQGAIRAIEAKLKEKNHGH